MGNLVTFQNSSTYIITDEVIKNSTTTLYQGTLKMNKTDTSGHYLCQFTSRRMDAQNWTVSTQTSKQAGMQGWREGESKGKS